MFHVIVDLIRPPVNRSVDSIASPRDYEVCKKCGHKTRLRRPRKADNLRCDGWISTESRQRNNGGNYRREGGNQRGPSANLGW